MESGFGEDEMDGQTESDEEDPEAAMARSRQQVEAKTVQVRPDLCSNIS